MGRKRPRPCSLVQLLAAATAVTVRPRTYEVFLLSPLTCGLQRYPAFVPSPPRRREPEETLPSLMTAATALRKRAQAPQALRAHGNPGKDDPDDPLPKTMDELYRRMANKPRVERRDDEPPVPLGPRDIQFIEEAVREVFRPTESESWWREHGEEWDKMADDPETAFALPSQAIDAWALEGFFGESHGLETTSPTKKRFSLVAYKAGSLAPNSAGQEDKLCRTPFMEYWDALPDLAETRRVYAFNLMDRMAALKFLMNCTMEDGFHGSGDDRQAGHFLWGYADMLDWMSRSGRLSAKPRSIKVDRTSWWGWASYVLTIVPLAAVADSGLLEEGLDITIVDGDHLQLPAVQRAVRAWRRVWRYSDPEVEMRSLMDVPVHDSLGEQLRRLHWAAHLESLEAVAALYGAEFEALSSTAEREFARGWCRAAHLFAAAAARTDLEHVLLPLGAGYFPERTLEDGKSGKNQKIPKDLESVPLGPPSLVAEAEGDALSALKTHRFVETLRWLGRLRMPFYKTLLATWRRACGSYPGRRAGVRALRAACYGGKTEKVATWGRSFLFLFVPDINYRKLTPPLGVDPAEHFEYDPAMKPRDPAKPPRRPSRSLPSNPLQWPWYSGRRPDPSQQEEDDDGLGDETAGMFPQGTAPSDMRLETLQRARREMLDRVREARGSVLQGGITEGSDAGEGDARSESGTMEGQEHDDNVKRGIAGDPPSANTLFM